MSITYYCFVKTFCGGEESIVQLSRHNFLPITMSKIGRWRVRQSIKIDRDHETGLVQSFPSFVFSIRLIAEARRKALYLKRGVKTH